MRVGCGFFLIFRAHTTKCCCKQYLYRYERTEEHDILGKVRETKDQATDRGIHALTDDFSILTREKCHGSSRPDPHETRISRGTRGVAGRVGSGRVGSGRVGSGGFQNLAGRVGSGGFQNLAGRVGSGQDVSKFSRVGSGTQPNSRDLTRPVKSPGFSLSFRFFPLSSYFVSFICLFFPTELRLLCVCVVMGTMCNVYVVVFLGWQVVQLVFPGANSETYAPVWTWHIVG